MKRLPDKSVSIIKSLLRAKKIFVNAYGNSEGMIEFNANTGIRLNDSGAQPSWLTGIG